ncbi:hypothetical protein HBI42_243440 [Parastagonospora nodorum]|nr:hypothetical protein HBI42_243440 [Parastagonospora nodorum]KAH6417359.1 hypothetical protein HBI59_252150 [Parastagonospora nodorum]
MAKYAPEWARQKRAEVVERASLGKDDMILDNVATVFNAMLSEQSGNAGKGKGLSIFAVPTLNGQTAQNSSTGKTEKGPKVCPCIRSHPQKPQSDKFHRWKPITCLKLQTAVTGSAPGNPIKLDDVDKKKILERYNKPEWQDLREQIKKSGWSTTPRKERSDKDHPIAIQASLIDPTLFTKESLGVYSTTFDQHPLHRSTILDSGACVHLVNDRSLIEKGTFVKATNGECVEAGTQHLPIDGVGTRIMRNLMIGPSGPHTVDLTLTNVKVVEGFHLNIVSEARLRDQGNVWYTGWDRTLRYGDPSENKLLYTLIRKYNLNFLELIESSYSLVSTIVKAVPRSYHPQRRGGDEQIWHQRSGHLGQRALQALTKHAQNVEITGIRRIECEHCATAHASQVISRRPKERSPRPFYRISWDLFDMHSGRLGEQWSLPIKDDYSGKIENNNLPSKSLPEIMKVIERYHQRVRTKYNLSIVEIHQDSDQATRPWRGRSRFEEWADENGIAIKATPSHTHEPNGSAERAGQEIITKAIKMRTSANLPNELWPEILDAAAWLHGMSPTAMHGYRSPNEVLDSWFRQYFRYYEPAVIRSRTADLRPDWSGIYAYGCRAYPLNLDRAAGTRHRFFKTNPRGHIGYLVGYRASNIYRIWIPLLNQVITTRNVRFDESRFFQGKNDENMEKESALEVADILHDGELDDPGLQIEDGLYLEERQTDEVRRDTESNLGGEPSAQTDQTAGQPNDQGVMQEETARDDSMASNRLRIRAGPPKDQNQLATPESTPEPGDMGGNLGLEAQSMGGDSQQQMHLAGRAGPSRSSDRIGSQRATPQRVTRSATRPGGLDSNTPDEADELLVRARRQLRQTTTPDPGATEPQAPRTQRMSRRQQGKAPENDQGTSTYLPLRRRRRDGDRDDQMGGAGTGVHALIADLDDNDGLWADFQNTFLPGARRAWDDRKSYKSMNAVIMAATLTDQTPKSTRLHQNELPDPPKTWKQFLQHKHKVWFEAAMRQEIEQLRKKDTWTIQPTSEAMIRPIPLKWVWTYKFDQDGMLLKCKARIVVRGDLQEKDSLDSTYAATLAARSFRAAMAIAAHFDLEVMQNDVTGAFLNATITKENPVLCELPDGFKEPGMCVRLNRALYGMRDSPLLWYEEFSGTLRSLGLISSKEEPCLFFDKDKKVLILFYVDDILLLYHKACEAFAKDLWIKITTKYEIQEQGPAEWFLGIRIVRNREKRTITLVHDTYIEKIAKKFNLIDGTFPATPLPSEELKKFEGEATKQEVKLYQEKVGSALYTAIMLRPDVAFAVSKLSHYLTNPSQTHMSTIDRVIMYLYRTRWEAIQYGNYDGPDLMICGDASFADDSITRRSSHGYIAMLFGGAILWKAARQSTVTTSTTEAELIALEHVAKETIALKRFFDELTFDLGDLWKIWCDNQQTIRLVVGRNERITTRLRHVDIQNMWLRQEHAKGSFSVEYLPTKEMPADGLTKALTHQQFDHFKQLLNLKDMVGLVTVNGNKV